MKEMLAAPSGFRPLETFPDPRNKVLVPGGLIERQLSHFTRHFKEVLGTLDNPLFIWLANGGKRLAEDLQIHFGIAKLPEYDFKPAQYSLYGDDTTAGKVPKLDESTYPFPIVEGRDCVIVDDLLHTGLTLSQAIQDIRSRQGNVTDVVLTGEKPESSPWNDMVRLAPWPEDVRRWSLFLYPDLWLQGRGMNTGELGRLDDDVIVRWDMEEDKKTYYLNAAKKRSKLRAVK